MLTLALETFPLCRSFEEKPTFQTTKDPGCMTRMYLVHSEPAVSSPPDASIAREAENSFLSSEGKAGDGSVLHLLQGQRQNVSVISPTLPCPPLHQKRLSSPCCSKMGTGKGTQGDSGGGGEKGQ